MAKYSIGIDFGTLSARALIVDVADGRELAASVFDYPHAVMSETLPSGKKLGIDWALQDPLDYIDAVLHTVPEVVKNSGVDSSDVIGIGVDFTACTLLPVSSDGTPLCFIDKYKNEPHAYVKLWKHHAAQAQADRLNSVAAERGEKWLSGYGGKVSSEWAVPKIMQVLDEAPEIYEAADRFVEAGDWIVWFLTGKESHSACFAGYKCLWNKQDGYPSNDFFVALDKRLDGIVGTKLSENISPAGTKAGELRADIAEKLLLSPGTAVAQAVIDAHVFVPASGIAEEGKMLIIMGTSSCHMLLSKHAKQPEGMCGAVEDGILPGFVGYEAGQACVGDHFQWFTEHCLPAAYKAEAERLGMDIHAFLRQKAEISKPGQSGLVALDWWNGNRSCLLDYDLSGMILGMTLMTRPEEIYRALIEATAYGTRMIVESFAAAGVKVNEIYASGGIAGKDPMTMQIYADVMDLPIRIAGSGQAGALGSAVFGAVAAGGKNGGYDSVFDAVSAMGKASDKVYVPDKNNAEIYGKLYHEYKLLHDYFGRGGNDVMKRLKNIKKSVVSRDRSKR